MTAKEAAKKLEISLSLLYRLIAEKRLACIRIGQRGRRGKVIVMEEHIRQFLKGLEDGRA